MSLETKQRGLSGEKRMDNARMDGAIPFLYGIVVWELFHRGLNECE